MPQPTHPSHPVVQGASALQRAAQAALGVLHDARTGDDETRTAFMLGRTGLASDGAQIEATGISPARLAAVKAYTNHKPDVVSLYKTTRALEDGVGLIETPRADVKQDRYQVPTPDGALIPVRVFTPQQVDISLAHGIQRTDDCMGTILFIHGGGWVTGSLGLYADACRDLALALGRRVVSVGYRRAPENRFPGPLEDCYAVAKALYAGEILPDVRPESIVLCGDSAGGNLTACLSLLARERGDFEVRCQMLLYPVVQSNYWDSTPYRSVIENGQDYMLTQQDMQEYLLLYINGPEDLSNPHLAPLLASDHSGLPRTLLISCELCPLRDEDEAYAAALASAGTESFCYRMLHAMHGYLIDPASAPTIEDTHTLMRAFLDGTPSPGELAQGEGVAWRAIRGIG